MSTVRSLCAAVTVLVFFGASPRPAEAQGDPLPPLPYVTRIYTVPEFPTSESPTAVVVAGEFPTGCGTIQETRLIDPHQVAVHLVEYLTCDVPHDWGAYFELGRLAPGQHEVEIALTYTGIDSSDTTRTYHGRFVFFVRGDSLPYVSDVRIVPKNFLPIEHPICPSDSIVVQIRGVFPSPCFGLKRIELIEPPYEHPLPEPPFVRLTVDDSACVLRQCPAVLKPWTASVVLPPLPARDYALTVQVGTVSCMDSIPPGGTIHEARFPFVVEPCGTIEPCFYEGWWHPGSRPLPPTRCDAYVAPDHPAEVTFTVRPEIPLAGLEGTFHLWPTGLRVSKIEAVGPARNMQLAWAPTAEGAHFVLFATDGALIPPCSLDSLGDSTNVPPPCPNPILRLTLEQTVARAPGITHVTAANLLGSDAEGHAVARCPILTLVPIEAIVCAEPDECDFNADGRLDVRDIVLMARCLGGGNSSEAVCADSNRFADCNGDAHRDLADILCCASRLLRSHSCPECPPDTSAPRPAPDVRVTFGAPDLRENLVDIPLRIDGLESIGGAMLALRFPVDRYDAAIVMSDGGEWLILSEVADGELRVGLVSLHDSRAAHPPGPTPKLALRLALKNGRSHGGSLRLMRGDFSGLDGVKLQVSLGNQSVAIDAAPALALSEGQPNPFRGETRMSLTIDRGADAEVGVYDLGGRRVATLYRGHLAAGVHPFVWRGTLDSGSRGPSGLYFVRVSVRGTHAVSKVVLLAD